MSSGDYLCRDEGNEIESLRAKIAQLQKGNEMLYSNLTYSKEAMNEEIERLRQENEKLKFQIEKGRPACIDESFEIGFENKRLKAENEQLRQALRKCSPFTHYDADEGELCYDCHMSYEHKQDCEYIKLIQTNKCVLEAGKCDKCKDIGGNTPYCKT